MASNNEHGSIPDAPLVMTTAEAYAAVRAGKHYGETITLTDDADGDGSLPETVERSLSSVVAGGAVEATETVRTYAMRAGVRVLQSIETIVSREPRGDS